MVKRDIPDSWLEDKPDIPPPKVENEFERWHDTYSVSRISELTVSDIKSTELEFQSEVESLKAEYRPGRLINPVMAQVAGKEPFTQEEFRKVRHHISAEAKRIRMNFKQAKGQREEKRNQQRADVLTTIANQVADSLTNIKISIELPNLKKLISDFVSFWKNLRRK